MAANAPMTAFAVMHALPRIVEQSPGEGLFTEALMAAAASNTPKRRTACAPSRRPCRQGGEVMSDPKYRDAAVGGCVEAVVEQRADGSTLIRSTEELRWFPDRLTDSLEQWAQDAPDRTLVAKRRRGGGDWVRISYAQMLQRAQAVGQSLVDLGLSVERPLAILSDNDLGT